MPEIVTFWMPEKQEISEVNKNSKTEKF